MHLQNLARFYKVFLKILSRNKIMTDRQPKSNIAPTFSKRGYNEASLSAKFSKRGYNEASLSAKLYGMKHKVYE